VAFGAGFDAGFAWVLLTDPAGLRSFAGFFGVAATRAFFTGTFLAALTLGPGDGFAFTGAAFAFGLDVDDFLEGTVLRRSFAMAAPVAAHAATDDDDRKRFGGVTLTDAPKWGQERRARSMAA
jgi:hypothetical protein